MRHNLMSTKQLLPIAVYNFKQSKQQKNLSLLPFVHVCVCECVRVCATLIHGLEQARQALYHWATCPPQLSSSVSQRESCPRFMNCK